MTLRSRSSVLIVRTAPVERMCRCACRVRHVHTANLCSRVIPPGAVHVEHVLSDFPGLAVPICGDCAVIVWPAEVYEIPS